MVSHPFTGSLTGKATGALAVVAFAGVLFLMLDLYGHIPIANAAIYAGIYTVILSLLGYAYWFLTAFIGIFWGKIILGLMAQIVSLGVLSLAIYTFEEEWFQYFVLDIPIFAVPGILIWIVLAQYYGNNREMAELEEEIMQERKASEEIDRISVKDGARLHIIKADELIHVQAYGDYVLLHTENARHIKEETMKYYEAHLPRNFIRIHRSSIVNSEKIIRIELATKDTYNVHLKNGTCLKASATGYRLLKERLML